ncbi:MAG: winged helix-turn-helix transcriptional regulator [bacterium]|nr:winged helix-turn-helix transcriptional regulator [bacterium]
MKNNDKHYADRARLLKALAHPTRLFIVETLSRSERCVADLTDMVGADMSTVSRHLALLRDAGILRSEKRGACIYYQLKCPCVLNFFTCIESVLEESS